MKIFGYTLTGLLCIFACSVACAQSILIGQTIALSGGVGEHGRAAQMGAEAYFDKVNRAGGIKGQKIVLKSMDDAGDSKRATTNAAELLSNPQIVALFGGTEGGPCVAALKEATRLRTPHIGCMGGSPELREPFNRYSFPVRAAHLSEFEKLISLAVQTGGKRLAFMHADTETGQKHLANVKKTLQKHKLELALALPLTKEFRVEVAAQQIVDNKIDIVLNHGSYSTYANLLLAVKKTSSQARFYAISSGAYQLLSLLKESGKGLVFSQIVPVKKHQYPLLFSEFHESMQRKSPEHRESISALEGYIAAKVLVAGLEKIGSKQATRESLTQSLERLGSFDIQGYQVLYKVDGRQGATFVDVLMGNGTGGAIY